MTFVHIYSEYTPVSADEARRNAFAQATWEKQYRRNLIPCPVRDECVQPLAFNGKRLPTVKAILDYGVAQHPRQHYFCFSNNDIAFVEEGFTARVEHYLRPRSEPRRAYALAARLVPGPLRRALTSSEILAYPFRNNGHDVFFFSRAWWAGVRDSFPDFVVGHSKWDNCLFFLVCTHGLRPFAQRKLMEHGLVQFWHYNSSRFCYTEDHLSFWRTEAGTGSDREAHNLGLFEQFWADAHARLHRQP